MTKGGLQNLIYITIQTLDHEVLNSIPFSTEPTIILFHNKTLRITEKEKIKMKFKELFSP